MQGAKRLQRSHPAIYDSLCEYAEKNGLSIGFYGGRQEVIDRILERSAKELPNLKIVTLTRRRFDL